MVVIRPQYDDVDDGRRLEEVTGNRPYDDGREPDRASRSAPYMPRYYDYEERRRPGRYEGRGPPPAYSQRSRYDRSFSPPRLSRERGRDPRDRDSYRSGHGRGRGPEIGLRASLRIAAIPIQGGGEEDVAAAPDAAAGLARP
eukprot:751621-Hanusia_phi.AAC.3